MSNESNKTVKNDVFSTVEETVQEQVKSAEKSFPNYQTSVTSLQQEYTEAFQNIIDSTIALQREFANKTGINTALPEATESAVNKTNEQINKVQDVQNKIALATMMLLVRISKPSTRMQRLLLILTKVYCNLG